MLARLYPFWEKYAACRSTKRWISYLASRASRYPHRIFAIYVKTYLASNASGRLDALAVILQYPQAMPVYIHTGENSVFLAQQHPKPFNNFSAINESDCVEIWLRTVPALFDIYEERHRRIFLRLCLWKLCVSLCSPRFHSSAVEWLLPVLSLRCPGVQGSSDCRLQCPGSYRSRKPTA